MKLIDKQMPIEAIILLFRLFPAVYFSIKYKIKGIHMIVCVIVPQRSHTMLKPEKANANELINEAVRLRFNDLRYKYINTDDRSGCKITKKVQAV